MKGFLSITTFKLPYPFTMGDHHNLILCLVCREKHYARDLFRRTKAPYNPMKYDFTKGLVHQKELDDHGDEMVCPTCGAGPEVNLGRRIRNFLVSAGR